MKPSHVDPGLRNQGRTERQTEMPLLGKHNIPEEGEHVEGQ